MKKIVIAFAMVVLVAGCSNSNTAEENTADSTNINMGNQSPMGDTANQINNRGVGYPADTSNRNGDDSISGSNPASRTTTPGNDAGGSDNDPQ